MHVYLKNEVQDLLELSHLLRHDPCSVASLCAYHIASHLPPDIHTYTVAPGLPESFEQQAWTRLTAAVQAIYASTSVPDSMQQLLTVGCGGRGVP